MRYVIFIAVVSCGHATVLQQPNTVAACDRAIDCGSIDSSERDQCVTCLEHIDQDKLKAVENAYGPLPPLESATCEQMTQVLEHTDIGNCIVQRWSYK